MRTKAIIEEELKQQYHKIGELRKQMLVINNQINLENEKIKSLQTEIKDKEAELLMDFIEVDSQWEIDRYVKFGRKTRLIKGDVIKVIKVNKKSLYIKIVKKFESKWMSGKLNTTEVKPSSGVIKIDSLVFYNNFLNIKDVRKQFNSWAKRNEALKEILD
jgi:hypothetical protein